MEKKDIFKQISSSLRKSYIFSGLAAAKLLCSHPGRAIFQYTVYVA